MSAFRKAILFAGWIPTLGGSGATVWWLESDRTLKDVLIRTDREILESNTDFQKIWLLFEDDEQFSKDIENIENLGWEGLAEWCKEKLSLPITEQNLTEFLPRAQKYCSKEGNIVVPKNIKDYRNFKNIFTMLKSNPDINLNKMSGSIIHLSDKKTDDAYYSFADNSVPERSELNIGKTPDDILGRKIFIGKGQKMLSKGKNKKLWAERSKKYNEGSKKFEELHEIWNLDAWTDKEGHEFEQWNILGERCEKLLTTDYPDKAFKEQYETEQELFNQYCTVSIETPEE